MRVYVPATWPMLRTLVKTGVLDPIGGTAFALTPALREAYISGDDEELEFAAMTQAARASLRLLAADPEAIRAVGLSVPKVAYLRDLAAHVEDGRLPVDRLADQDDEAVAAELTAVKGLGVWTAHMFLIFHLGRPDVLPVGDLGVRRAVERNYGHEELPDAETLERLAERWRPYRSLASLYLWHSLDNAPD